MKKPTNAKVTPTTAPESRASTATRETNPTGWPALRGGLNRASVAIASALRPYWPSVRQWLGGILTAALTWLAFFISPLQEIINHWIWKEQVSIVVQDSFNIPEGGRFRLPVTLMAKGHMGIAGGEITVKPAGDSVVFDTLSAITAKTDDSLVTAVFEGEVKSDGATTVTVNFHNRYNDAGTVPPVVTAINVRSNLDQGSVVDSNFSGVWQLKVDDQMGTLLLVEEGGSLGGTATLRVAPGRERQFVVEGSRDGSRFDIELYEPTNGITKRLVLGGTFTTVNGYISVVGNTTRQTFVDDGWQVDDGAVLGVFNADARVRSTTGAHQ